jgi:F-type H+-transporting ATPase subunit gamma
MEMISVAKLNRTEKQLISFKPYFSKLDEVFSRFISCKKDLSSPFLSGNASRDACLCVITSDSGLCGVYNDNIIRSAEEFINARGKDSVKLLVLGRRGFNYFQRKGYQILENYVGLNGRYSPKVCDDISSALIDLYLSGKAGEVFVSYTHFKTALIHKPGLIKLLNLGTRDPKEIDYIAEPDMGDIIDELIPKYVSLKMRLIILESFTSEHSARTLAMKMATDNAEELSAKLLLLRNKVRQATITQDIMEIISSAEALKG